MKYLRYILTTLVITAFFGGYFYYLTFSGLMDPNPVSDTIITLARPYPALTNPKEITLNCDYHGKALTVNETLYGSLYDYYKANPAKKNAYLNNKQANFVFVYNQDGTIRDLAAKISALGVQNGLSSDQTLDLSACFLQGIPYDNVKAAKILGTDFASQPVDQVIPRYPYETLYDNLGICTDKTYLGAAVMRELGYKMAIMTFDAQKHMSLDVAVPAGYGSFGTNYGIMELTGSGFLVGDVPELSATAGLAINNFQTLPQGDGTAPAPTQLQLANPSSVIDLATGNTYSRIIERTTTRQKLEELKPQITALQTAYKQAQGVLKDSETRLAAAENTYHAQPTQANYDAYTAIYNQYTADYNTAQSKVKQYNNMVNLYNSYVEKYKQF